MCVGGLIKFFPYTFADGDLSRYQYAKVCCCFPETNQTEMLVSPLSSLSLLSLLSLAIFLSLLCSADSDVFCVLCVCVCAVWSQHCVRI